VIDISFPQDSCTGLAGPGMVDLVHLVYLVCLVQPNKRDKPDKPNNSLLPLADFISSL
jgi:hypothetical protein